MNTDFLNSRGRAILLDFLKNEFDSKANSILSVYDQITELYSDVNSVINISAIKNPDEIYIKHFLDSIYPYKFFSGACCDVGCGGGFPCLPLSVITDCEFLGVDGVGKKLTLINRCKKELGLTNINSLHARAEEMKRYFYYFDTVCARAVADTDKILSYCAPLCKSGGKIILYKTQNEKKAKKETEQKKKVLLIDTKDYILPETDIKRRLFVYKKL